MQESVHYLQEATTALEREKRRIEEEIAAFKEFREAVANLHVQHTDPALGAGTPETSVAPLTVSDGGRTSPLTRVRELYRETVMETKTAEEYEETPVEHMTEEFGADVSKAVFAGSMVIPQLKFALVERSREAAQDRREVIERIEREQSVISNAENCFEFVCDKLRTVELIDHSTLDDAYHCYERVTELERYCDELAVERQRMLRVTLYDDYRHRYFVQYLYKPCSFDFPILSGLATLGERLRRTGTKIENRIVGTGRTPTPRNA